MNSAEEATEKDGDSVEDVNQKDGNKLTEDSQATPLETSGVSLQLSDSDNEKSKETEEPREGMVLCCQKFSDLL
jgi:hypothetical protein